MVTRVDRLMGELSARHGAEAEFMERLKPSIERILEEDTPEEARPELLELLAETCEREVRTKKSAEAMRVAFRGFFDNIQRLIYENYRLRGGTEPFPGDPQDG